LNISIHSGDIRGQSQKWSKIMPNLAYFWPQVFFERGERARKFLGRPYKTELVFDHVAKFCNDWPRNLGDLTLNKELQQNIRPSRTIVPDSLITRLLEHNAHNAEQHNA